MSQQFNISESISYKNNINLSNNSNQNLLSYINISKGKIITLLRTVFSFLSDNSLLKIDPPTSFQKYTIDTKLIQTMSKAFFFYTSNDPENGKNVLHELLKERYSKFLKYFEQNINYFSNSKELQFRYCLIQGLILLWLIETKYDTQYYDDYIRLINKIINLDNENISDDKNYLKNFLNTIIKFPFIKQNKELLKNVLEANECDDSIIDYLDENLNNYIQKKNSAFKKDIFNENSVLNRGKKNIKTKNHDSNILLFKDNSISHRRKSLSNTGSQKGSFTSINSSGFYTPEFKHSKRDSIRHFRRFTINNINNPKTSFISNKSESFSRANSMSDGMNNLLNKCEEGKHINNSFSNNKNNNGPKSTKSKLRLAIEGHFYTNDDYKNNFDFPNNNNNTSKFSFISELNENKNDINNNDNNINSKNIIEHDDIYDCENEVESKLVSVDELPINPNMSIISNSNSKNIGIEPQNIIQETKEEEEIDENEQINEKNNNNNKQHNNNYVKILTDNEINDFFNKQFSDNKNNKKKQFNKNNNNIKIINNC